MLNFRYSRQGQLTMHRKRHTGEKPHKCQYCNKEFIRREVMRQHENIHTDTRPFKCRYCEKYFRYDHFVVYFSVADGTFLQLMMYSSQSDATVTSFNYINFISTETKVRGRCMRDFTLVNDHLNASSAVEVSVNLGT